MKQKNNNAGLMYTLAIGSIIFMGFLIITQTSSYLFADSSLKTLSESRGNWIKSDLTGRHNQTKTFDVYYSTKIKASPDRGIVQLSIFREYTEHGKEQFYRWSPRSRAGIVVTEMVILLNTKKELMKVKVMKDQFTDGNVEATEVQESWKALKKNSREYGYLKIANDILANK